MIVVPLGKYNNQPSYTWFAKGNITINGESNGYSGGTHQFKNIDRATRLGGSKIDDNREESGDRNGGGDRRRRARGVERNGRPGLGGNLPTPPGDTDPVDIQVFTNGIATVTATANTGGTTPSVTHTFSPLKILHVRMIYGIISNVQIPGIWLEITGVLTN